MAWCYTMPATPHPGAYFILTKVVARRARLLTSQMDKGRPLPRDMQLGRSRDLNPGSVTITSASLSPPRCSLVS